MDEKVLGKFKGEVAQVVRVLWEACSVASIHLETFTQVAKQLTRRKEGFIRDKGHFKATCRKITHNIIEREVEKRKGKTRELKVDQSLKEGIAKYVAKYVSKKKRAPAK